MKYDCANSDMSSRMSPMNGISKAAFRDVVSPNRPTKADENTPSEHIAMLLQNNRISSLNKKKPTMKRLKMFDSSPALSVTMLSCRL